MSFSADQEIMRLNKRNWIMQEQLNRLEKDFVALSKIKDRVIVLETFLRVKFPEFSTVDPSFGSFSQERPHQTSFEHRSKRVFSATGWQSLHPPDSQAPSRISGLRAVDNAFFTDEECDDKGDDDESIKMVRNESHSKTARGSGVKASESRSSKPCEERSVEGVSQTKVAKWLNNHNIEANSDISPERKSRPKESPPEAGKKQKRSKIMRKQSDKRSKTTSANRSTSGGNANIGKCMGNSSCKKVARKGCDVCGIFLCTEHRYTSITCPNYLDSIKDCFRELENSVDSLGTKDSFSHEDRPDKDTKEGMGRCVCCTAGKKRKVSRTRCQVCKRSICAEHQVRKVRCEDHRFDRFNSVVPDSLSDSDESSSVSSSIRSDIIDHIDAI